MSTPSDSTPELRSPAPRKRKVNGAGALTGEQPNLQELLQALQAMKMGDFSVRMRSDQVGIAGKIADTFNEIVATNERMAEKLETGGSEGRRVGKEGSYRC